MDNILNNPIKFNNSGLGEDPGIQYNGSELTIISYNTIGSVPVLRKIIPGFGLLSSNENLTTDITLTVDFGIGEYNVSPGNHTHPYLPIEGGTLLTPAILNLNTLNSVLINSNEIYTPKITSSTDLDLRSEQNLIKLTPNNVSNQIIIDSGLNKSIYPKTNNLMSLGTETNLWKEIHTLSVNSLYLNSLNLNITNNADIKNLISASINTNSLIVGDVNISGNLNIFGSGIINNENLICNIKSKFNYGIDVFNNLNANNGINTNFITATNTANNLIISSESTIEKKITLISSNITNRNTGFVIDGAAVQGFAGLMIYPTLFQQGGVTDDNNMFLGKGQIVDGVWTTTGFVDNIFTGMASRYLLCTNINSAFSSNSGITVMNQFPLHSNRTIISSLDCLFPDSNSESDWNTILSSYLTTSSGQGIDGRPDNICHWLTTFGWASGGQPSTANRKMVISSMTGTIESIGTFETGANFVDYVEYFPNNEGVEIQPGIIVTLNNDGVSIANLDDEISGVVSHTGGIVSGNSPFCWQGRYLYDEWGRPIYEEMLDPLWQSEVPDPTWNSKIPDPNNPNIFIDNLTERVYVPNPKQQEIISVPKENPQWDPNLPQVSRKERPDQWTPVGLLGQLNVRVDETVVPNCKIKAGNNGVGTISTSKTGLRCMKIKQPFNSELGYAIAFCVINVMF